MTSNAPTHTLECRIYYEDTDACAIVYHANYLKFAERARTEMLRDCGLNRTALIPDQEVNFVVRHMEIDYRLPARLDDVIKVTSCISAMAGSSFTMMQQILLQETVLVTLKTVIVCVDIAQMKPLRMPASLRDALKPYTQSA